MHHVHPPGSASSVSTVKCIVRSAGLGGERIVSSGDGDKNKPKVAVQASMATAKTVITAEPVADRRLIDLALLAIVGNALVKVLRPAVNRRQWKLQVQMLIEKVCSLTFNHAIMN